MTTAMSVSPVVDVDSVEGRQTMTTAMSVLPVADVDSV